MELARGAVDIGVYVRDIDACLRFYCDGLGLPKVGEIEFPGGRVQHRIAIGESLLKLMQFPDGEAPPAGPPGRMAASGIRYITIAVRDLAALVTELEARGLSFVVPPRPSPSGATIAMLEDPEGNTVELLQPS
jgi:catechol 2,3-dioxygenase-like lactoylglutathione lyase family enzyme